MSQRNEALFEIHGVSPEHTPEQVIAVGNALLIALGSSGPLSAREMDELLRIAAEYGAPPDALERWKRFDYANGKISDHLQLDPRLARHLLYEAIRIRRAGAPSGPAANLGSVAGALGTEPGVLETLQAVVTAEEALREARAMLSATGEKVTGTKLQKAPGATTGAFATLAEKERKMRQLRLSTMETGKPAR